MTYSDLKATREALAKNENLKIQIGLLFFDAMSMKSEPTSHTASVMKLIDLALLEIVLVDPELAAAAGEAEKKEDAAEELGRRLWKEHTGHYFGPRVEHACIEDSKFGPFLRAFASAVTSNHP